MLGCTKINYMIWFTKKTFWTTSNVPCVNKLFIGLNDKKLYHQFTHALKKPHMFQTEKSVRKERYGMD